MFSIVTYILVGLVTLERPVSSESTDCVVASETMTCKHHLPKNVYPNISKIVVEDYLNSTIDDLVFKGSNWDGVTSLDIIVNAMTHFSLKESNFFYVSTRLTYLGIHAPKMSNIDKGSFNGLTNVRILNLSNSVYIHGEQLTTALLESKLRLIELNLCYIATARPLQIDQNFLQMMSNTKLERLILSGSDIVLTGPLISENLTFNLTHMDISNTTLAVWNLDQHSVVKILTLITEHLKVLDMSYPKTYAVFEHNRQFLLNTTFIYKCNGYKFLDILFKTQHLFLNDLYRFKIYANDSLVDISACNVHLKSLQMKDNNFTYLNATIRWPLDNNLETIDLSCNEMEYLNKNFFTGLSKLKFLDISANNLCSMEHSDDFTSLLSAFPELHCFNLSHNDLAFLPKHMFVNNAELATLDLSYNLLTSITFDVHQFKNIKEISLKNNRILYLQTTQYMKLDLLLPADIDISQNPLICKCKSVDFLKWVTFKLQPQTNRVYNCEQDGNIVSIDDKIIDKSKYLCKIPAIIIAWTCGSFAICLTGFIIIAVSFKKYRNAKEKRSRSRFIDELAEGTLSQNYLCFFIFSSNEDNNMTARVNSSIDQNLKLLTGISHRSLICTGDQNFRPGHSIINEAYRLINASFVIVCIVSRSFCASPWCELEMRLAKERNKPILLVFTEEVERLTMPVIMQNIFDTQTRAKVIFENDICILVPGYDVMSESILNLALREYVSVKRGIFSYV